MPTTTLEKTITRHLGNDVSIDFELIPGGEFIMGGTGFDDPDEEPQHRVVISNDFYLGKFPVTQKQFLQFKPGHEFHHKEKPNHPAENVTWQEAVDFCRWLSELDSKVRETELVGNLPTEAEWEYACRGNLGKDRSLEYYTGDGEIALKRAGWYSQNSNNSTQPVGKLAPNDFGLFDMHGNVLEWCRDSWDSNAYKKRIDGIVDPFIDGSIGSLRVIRGGSFDDSAVHCRSAFRFRRRPDYRFWYLGLRAALFPGS